MDPVTESKLKNIETLYFRRADAMAAREAVRFQYLGEWKNNLELAIARIIKYFRDIEAVNALEIFSPLYQDVKRGIPMCMLSGRPYYGLDGRLAFKDPTQNIGAWKLGGANGVSFLGPYYLWTYPYDDYVKAPAYRINEELIRKYNIGDVRNEFLSVYNGTQARLSSYLTLDWLSSYISIVPSLWTGGVSKLPTNDLQAVMSLIVQVWFLSLYSEPSLYTTLQNGESLYNQVIAKTVECLNIQLQIDDAMEDLQNSMTQAYAS